MSAGEGEAVAPAANEALQPTGADGIRLDAWLAACEGQVHLAREHVARS